MKTDVVIVAAGRSLRFGGDIPKQYCTLAGRSILCHSVEKFTSHPSVGKLVVVIAKSDVSLFETAFAQNPPKFVFGGETRSQSVQAGLQALQSDSCGHVLIHDGARPFVTHQDISTVLAALEKVEACAPALPIIDAIKEVDAISGKITQNANRNQFQRMQTPQGFRFDKIWTAFENIDPKNSYDDDMGIALQAGLSCSTVLGNPDNFKITSRNDLQKAEQTMGQGSKICVTGTGVDVHQIVPGNSITLCGITMDCNFSLNGHSDADVGLHAITDAILGAMALGDIGDHFPPSDSKWKNANSSIFLQHAAKLTKERGAKIIHVDVTLICEAPKINPVREQMRSSIAKILLLDINQISVKATTTEQLGFTGRKEGIAALASVTVLKELA